MSAGRLIAKEIKTAKLQTKHLIIEEDSEPAKSTIGQVTIKAGESSVEVRNERVGSDSQIFITFLNNPNAFWWISKKDEGVFDVFLSNATPADLTFDYWIVDTAPQ